MNPIDITAKAGLIGAIALTLTLPAQAQSLQEVAQQYVDQNYGNNPLAILADSGCNAALAGTQFSPTVSNCNRLRNYAYQYWQTVYSPGSFGR